MRASAGRRALLGAAAGSALALAVPPLRAQPKFPMRVVRIVVPFAVGVGPDTVVRTLAEPLARRWRQPVIVDNKPGASGIVAFGELRRTPPDGHTLFLADTATMAVNPLLHDRLPYDPARDLEPLTLLFRATFVILVGGGGRWSGVAPLLDAARREPGRISYASLGNGHASQIAVEAMALVAGVELLHVPFKDASALFTAVASGEVDFTVFSLHSVAGLLASGRLKALAVAARRRLAEQPQLPTLREAGGPDTTMHPWAGLVAPAGTPTPVLAQLRRDIVAAIDSAEMRTRIEALGFELTPSTAQAFRDQVSADLALVRPLVAAGRVSRL